ncbi:MAG: type I secretion system permease/ATPase [Brevundimonas sp.]|uniref:type I secretion system permease/ATPase n=1 Tax=Brevundimonas sp. TaxID=1871086 RepID=UPI002733C9EC|nr:type I secretion system permease/ATPase [Brevundimonas sp.]MDP3377241.1 type I secretion system permease/ATPase [Brevundimonas sp.]
MFNDLIPRKPGTEPLAEAIKACRPHLVWAAIFSALVNLLYLTPTIYMLQVYDRVVPTGGLQTLLLVSAIAVFALATLALLDWLRTRLLVRAGLRLDRLLVGRLLGRVVDLQVQSPGSQVLREFDHVRTAVSGQGVLSLFDAPWTPIYIGCCFLLHPALGALTLVGAIVLLILAVLNERDSRPRLNQAMKDSQTAYAAQENMAGQSEVVRALGMRQAGIALQVQQRQVATARQVEAQFTGGRYTGIIKFLRLMLQSASLGLAALLTVQGHISAGSIIAASVLLTRAVQPIEQMVGAWPTLVQAKASWKALIDLFAATARVDRVTTTLPAPEGRLGLENVTVRLPGSEVPQLRGITLTLEPGQVLGVIGPSGSGKTTLARVVAGAIPPTSGSVRLDGADYDAREGDTLAEHIGYLPQVPGLFSGSVKDNISRFRSALGVDPEQIDREAVAAAKAAGVHEMILRLPHGYDTVLGHNGAGLSVGQSQRVALARALYRNPVLLVLDEPNANLDQEGEAALTQAIKGATARGASVLMVAHRAGVLGIADRLLMLREGTVQIEGPRDEVMMRLNPGRAKPTVVPPPGAQSA